LNPIFDHYDCIVVIYKLYGEGGEKMRRVAAEKCDTKCLDNQTI
jgi:hypothetical protein